MAGVETGVRIPVGTPAFAFGFEGYGVASQPDKMFSPQRGIRWGVGALGEFLDQHGSAKRVKVAELLG